MTTNTTIFLLGLVVGTALLGAGLLLGYWFGRKAEPNEVVDKQQFLSFLRRLSNWTTEFSGNVSTYQSEIVRINEQATTEDIVTTDDVRDLLARIMVANDQLQKRLDSAEERLAKQTDQISNYLSEARTDGLTGLFNRRAFDSATDELFSDWKKKGQAFSLALIDIDHFKQVNDTYGHPAGDAVLTSVASFLQTELDEVICVARYGGEEFAVLSLNSVDKLSEAVDQLRSQIGRLEVEHDNHHISITLSGGTAAIMSEDTIGKLVRRADEALYASKLAGRNRVHKHDGSICELITRIAPPSPADVTEPIAESDARETDSANSRIQERLQRIVQEETRRMIER